MIDIFTVFSEEYFQATAKRSLYRDSVHQVGVGMRPGASPQHVRMNY